MAEWSALRTNTFGDPSSILYEVTSFFEVLRVSYITILIILN